MAIKTFVSNGDQWSQVSSADAVNVGCSMTSWDPTQIDWTKYTTTPVDITWTSAGIGANPAPYDITISPYDNSFKGPIGCQNNFINSDFTWASFNARSEFTKPAGVRPDVLMGFFSQYVHAMMFIADGLTYVVPFMERLGMIWIQHELNKWTAYDRKEFYEFIDNPDATVFTGTALNKREVQKTMSEAKDE